MRRYSGTADLCALKRLLPEEWAETVASAMEKHDGRVPEAAESLGVSKRLMYRWLGEMRLRGVRRAPMGAPVGTKHEKRGR